MSKKKNKKKSGQVPHINKYVSDQNFDSGGIKRAIKVGKKQLGKGEKKRKVVNIKMPDGSEPDIQSYSHSGTHRSKHGRISIEDRYNAIASEPGILGNISVEGRPSRHRTLDDIPDRIFREALSQRVEVDYESIFVFEKGFRGDYSVTSKDPGKTFIRSLIYNGSFERTEIYDYDYKNYNSLERVKINNKGKAGLDGEIKAIRKVIQKGIGRQGEISFH